MHTVFFVRLYHMQTRFHQQFTRSREEMEAIDAFLISTDAVEPEKVSGVLQTRRTNNSETKIPAMHLTTLRILCIREII